jgi:hypothetical protein
MWHCSGSRCIEALGLLSSEEAVLECLKTSGGIDSVLVIDYMGCVDAQV